MTKFVSLKFSKLTKSIDDLHFFVICYFLFVLYFVPVNYVILIVFLSVADEARAVRRSWLLFVALLARETVGIFYNVYLTKQ